MGRELDDVLWGDDPADSTTLGASAMFSGPPLPPLPAVGKFGDFEILGRLARGGMADVFLARERAIGMTRHVVLKRILPEYEDDAEFQRLFLEEGSVATRFFHPNVCHVYELGETDGRTFLTLEFVHGVTLQRLAQRAFERGGMAAKIAAYVIGKVAAGLDYVHRATGVDGRPLDIVHRDVTPQNIMIGWDGRVKLLDFGIAKTSKAAADGQISGKYAYLSPEQVRSKPLDGRSDVFALGVCLYETLTGAPLYHRESVPVMMQAVVYDPVPSAREKRSDLDPAFDAIVQRALQKEPAARFATAGEMSEALDRCCGGIDERDVAAYLDTLFAANERDPLPPTSAVFTGAFGAQPSAAIAAPAVKAGAASGRWPVIGVVVLALALAGSAAFLLLR